MKWRLVMKRKSRGRFRIIQQRRICGILALFVVSITLRTNMYILRGLPNLGNDNSGLYSQKTSEFFRQPAEKGISSLPLMNQTKDRTPLLNILKFANITLSSDMIESLPTWEEVTSKFGNTPQIIGLETCHVFRRSVAKRHRIIAPAGVFNSGTNVLFTNMANNCKIFKKRRKPQYTGVHWQVNWGKHQSPRFRFNHSIREDFNNSMYLPIVIIRDPWTWFQSMCRFPYTANWFHVPGPDGHCPNFLPNHVEQKWFAKSLSEVRDYFDGDRFLMKSVMMKANYTLDKEVIPVKVKYKSEVARHDSLAHFWKDWYKEYYDATFPRLMIRLEDLVFFPRQVLRSICECVNGTFANETSFKLGGNSTKENSSEQHSRTLKTNLASSFSLHVHSNRTLGMTSDDYYYARSVLDNSTMSIFGYQHPSYGN